MSKKCCKIVSGESPAQDRMCELPGFGQINKNWFCRFDYFNHYKIFPLQYVYGVFLWQESSIYHPDRALVCFQTAYLAGKCAEKLTQEHPEIERGFVERTIYVKDVLNSYKPVAV